MMRHTVRFAVRSIRTWILLATPGLFLSAIGNLAAAEDTQPGRARVFLLAGQSNMRGHGSNSELLPPYAEAQTNVALWNRTVWIDLAPGFGRTTNEFGPEVSFGYTVKRALPPDRIFLVKYAIGGTALYNDWAPPDGRQYTVFTNIAHAALANLDANGVDYEISAMLWLQGESDAHEGQGAAYEANLRHFISEMRSFFKVPDLPFYIARVRTYYGTAEQSGLVRTAQVVVAESTINVEWFDTDSYNPLINNGHYNTDGQISIGIDFANTYLDSGPSGTFRAWSQAKGLDGTTGKEAGFSDDPDGDGVANGFEWVSGGNPLLVDNSNQALVPTLASNSMFSFSFRREEDSIGRIDLGVEWSTDLSSAWSNSFSVHEGVGGRYSKTNGFIVEIDDAPDPDRVTVHVPDTIEERNLFFRLRASQP
ncbi:MAG: hypothetical protein JXB13_03725 [Phycisphaerae bacterium]|nr:hypothetical protein [Phycisphaerae bacterium]